MKKSKRIVFAFIAAVFAVLIIELFSGVTCCFLSRHGVLFLQNCENEAEKLKKSNDQEPDKEIILPPWLTHKDDGETLIHPYLGYIYNPKKKNATDFGFNDKKSPLQNEGKDRIIIGIFGGSVAEMFYVFGGEELKKELSAYAEFKNKEIVLVNYALGGFKQPQQLMALNYVLSLGGDLDIALNIDGFNEVVLPVVHNLPNGVCPWFPMRWDLKVAYNTISRDDILRLADIYRLKSRQENMLKGLSRGFLRYSPTAGLLREYIYSSYQRRICKERTRLFESKKKNSRSLLTCGPEAVFEDDQALYTRLSRIWSRSSELMYDICRSNGIEYFQFLQPCQYLEGTKKMSAKELSIAIDKNAAHLEAVRKGYPYLENEGKRLAAEGICFTDLTGAFSNVEEPVYIDNFCHFGTLGNKILAGKIARVIAEKTAKKTSGNKSSL